MSAHEMPSLSMPCARMEDRAGLAARAINFARLMGFEQRACWEIGIVVQELVSNLVRHGGGGRLEIHAKSGAIEVIALDSGPGIPFQVLQARESWSRGLGAVRRFMHDLEIFTSDAQDVRIRLSQGNRDATTGTRILARRYLGRP